MKENAFYCPPVVLEAAKVMLERDLLQGPSSMGSLQATGHEVEEHQTFENTPWD